MSYSKGKPWTRDQKIGLAGLALTVIALLAGILFPELRVWVHLEKPPAPAPATIPTPQLSSPSVSSLPPIPESKPVQKPGKHPSAKPKVATPAPAIQAIAPNGIAIAGGTVTNPTVNNYEPPQRALTTSQRSELVQLLRQSGAFTVVVRNAEANFEAQTYCDSLKSVLREAGWTVLDNLRFIPESRQGQGLLIIVNDVNKAPPTAVALYNCFKQVGIEIGGVSIPDVMNNPNDTVLYVGVR